MTERRPHWDDDLLAAVLRYLHDPAPLTDDDRAWNIVEAVEDWQNRKEAEQAEAAIARVRELCDDFEHEENLNGGIGRYAVVRVDRVRSALNGDSDE